VPVALPQRLEPYWLIDAMGGFGFGFQSITALRGLHTLVSAKITVPSSYLFTEEYKQWLPRSRYSQKAVVNLSHCQTSMT
jgi:hypothetical protein